MTAREDILNSIRRARGRKTGAPPKSAMERLNAPSLNIIPERGKVADDLKIKQFIIEAEKVQATTKSIKTSGEIANAVSDYLKSNNLPASIKVSNDPLIYQVNWQKTPALNVSNEPICGSDEVGVSVAYSGIAETGTLVFLSGPDNPTRLNFYPLTHIAVVQAKNITGAYETVWQRIRAQNKSKNAKGIMPRAVNFITGPSRTADIEQTLLLGAHGPQRLHIIIVGE